MKKSLATPLQGKGRRSILGFGSVSSKTHPKERKRLTFSANKSRLHTSTVGSKRLLFLLDINISTGVKIL